MKETISVQPKQMKLEKRMDNAKRVRWSMLLSHHPPSQYCRTYKIFGIRLCARCLGIPIGMVLYAALGMKTPWFLIVLLPIPTFLNFLLQELGKVKSRNYLKTVLTLFLGMYLIENILKFISGNFLAGFCMVGYLIGIEFIIAKIMDKEGKLAPLIKLYEGGVYIEK